MPVQPKRIPRYVSCGCILAVLIFAATVLWSILDKSGSDDWKIRLLLFWIVIPAMILFVVAVWILEIVFRWFSRRHGAKRLK
jgi:hypothetical protein